MEIDMNEIMRWYNAQRAAGKVVQPWEVEAAYKGKMEGVLNKAFQGKQLALAQSSLDEKKRMNTELLRQQDLDREAAIKAGKWKLGGQLASTAGLYYGLS